MNKKVIFVISFFVLAGLSSCILLEPVHELLSGEEKACTSDAESDHCCFICHMNHHLWTKQENQSQRTPLVRSSGILLSGFFASPDVPHSAIFHPPLAF